MTDRLDLFRLVTKKTKKEWIQRPNLHQTFAAFIKGIQAKDKLFSLGYSVTQGDQWITEGERALGIHVLGAPREGKSKFLEYIVRHSIDLLVADERRIAAKELQPRDRRSLGLTFIDPSAGGDTTEKILAYCASVGFTKIILIDPYRIDTFKKIPPLNPFFMPIRRLTESFRVLFDVRDPAKISNIETYLRALFNILRSCGLTLSDIYPFTFSPEDPKYDDYAPERWAILSRARGVAKTMHFSKRRILEKNIHEVELAYRNYNTWKSEIGSTVRRLNVLFQTDISYNLYNHREGLNFESLVSDGWIILVSVSDEKLDDLEARLLATLVINNVIYSIERIRRKGYDKPYHLFIDEAGEYATTQIAKVLNLKQKIKLWTVLAHQYMGQLKDPVIKDAIRNGTKIKAAFYIEDQDERTQVIKMLGYGGELEPKDVSYVLRDQEQREMVLKIGKRDPVVCKVFDTPDAPKNEEFVQMILSSNNYVTEEQIEEDYAKRFSRKDSIRPERTAKPNNRAISKSNGSKARHSTKDAQTDEGKESSSSKASTNTKSTWDNLFMETGGGKTPSLKEQNYKHDIKIFDVYVSLRLAGISMEWTPKSDQKQGLRYDASLKAFGNQFYFEIETGTHTVEQIEQKVDAYLKIPGYFFVVFTVQDYRPNPFEKVTKTAKDFGSDIIGMLDSKRRASGKPLGRQFLVTPHNVFTSNPLAEILISHQQKAYSLQSLEEGWSSQPFIPQSD